MDSASHPPRQDDVGFPGLLVVSLILMIFMVSAISLLAVTGATWALWLAFAVMFVSCIALMASIAAMFNEPDGSGTAPEAKTRPVAHGGHR